MRIRVLPKEITEKIAAGEVVERPASVIKELMENALDAGSTRLSVAIGPEVVDLLEVADNGSGMNPEEISLALERHATSKIEAEQDLYNISTLGFRGEALASIAAVADLRIESRTEPASLGVRLSVRVGEGSQAEDMGMPKGTRVMVRNLFRTTPARLKFLRSRQTECGHISDTFIRLALSRTDVSFQLKRSGKIWLQAPAVDDLRARVAKLLGWELAEELRSVAGQGGECRLEGLVGPPELHRVSNRGLFLFVNRRPVRDLLLQRAVREAYHGLLPKGRFPVAVLFLEVPFSHVDVNVHPTKMEVHFAHPEQVRDMFVQSISRAFQKAPWSREETSSRPPPAKRSFPYDPPLPRPERSDRHHYEETRPEPVREPGIICEERPEHPIGEGKFYGTSPQHSEPLFTRLRIIGQFKESFLVCEYEDHLVLIDQHAAHERIVYEKLQEASLKDGGSIQGLLIPVVVELPPREARCLAGHLESLLGYGLEVESYGGNSFVVKSLPSLIADGDPKSLLQDIAEELVELDRTKQLDTMRSHVLARMACHSVVRAGQSMEHEEMEALLESLDFKPGLLSCPHGRPVMIAWSLLEIEKRFHRH